MPAVYTPVEGFNGTVAGVYFRDGAAETDDPTALQYFTSAGYRIGVDAPPVSLTADEPADVESAEGSPEGTPTPSAPETVPNAAPVEERPKRPYPQANKGEWFDYLSQVKPGHGLTIEDNTKAEFIAAAG